MQQVSLSKVLPMRLMSLAAAMLTAGCTAASPGAAQTVAPPFKIEQQGQFQQPWALAFLPDGGMLVTEKAGRLKLRQADGGVTDVKGVPAVAFSSQGGLLDVVTAPDYAKSNTIYLTYSEPVAGSSQLALARARLGGVVPVCGAGVKNCPTVTQYELTGLSVIWRSGSAGKGGQFGAIVAFAPDGKSLFLTSGERQRFTPSQDPDQALGKIVRLTLDGKPWPGNPMAGRTGAATVRVTDPPRNTVTATTAAVRTIAARNPNTTPAETWSTGHRNPYGLAFDARGNLWEHEMGPRGGDEVNLILPGRNYGWPLVSQGDNYDGTPIPRHESRPDLEAPKVFWNPSISPAGLIVYSGKMFPEWRGSLLMGALGGQALIRIAVDGTNARKADQWNMSARIRFVAEAPDGAVWLLEDEGPLVRLTKG